MSADLKDLGAIDRGARAERILKDPLVVEARERVRTAILTAIETSPARDSEGREHLYQRLKALSDVMGCLEQAMRDAKVVLHLQEEKRRFKLFR